MSEVRTFKQLRDEVLRYLDEAGDTSTTKDVVDDTLRALHSSRLTERKWNFMKWDVQQTITTVVGQKFYSLHPEFFRPVFFYNRTAKRTLAQVTDGTLLPAESGFEPDYDTGLGDEDWTDSTGSAYRFRLSSIQPVRVQPSSASVLEVSGQASMTVTIKGETSDGDVASETLTVGTPGSIQFTKILQVTKGDGWTATMTLAAGATTLLTLRSDEYGRQYRQFELLNEPTSAETLIYEFYRRPSYLGSENSIPDIPAPFSRLLVYDALLQLSAYNENLTGGNKSLWKEEQFRLEQGLLEYDDGPDALGAAIQYQSYIPRD